MMQPLRRQRVAKGLHHMALPHHFSEILGPVFAGKDEVGHSRAFYGPASARLMPGHWSATLGGMFAAEASRR